MSTITKKDLVDRIAESTNTKQELVKPVIHPFFDEIISEFAKSNCLEFRDFGVLESRKCAPRTAHNPKTLKRIEVPAKRVMRFKAGRLIKQKLNSCKARW
jgi:nucleoid DNA-binding protein